MVDETVKVEAIVVVRNDGEFHQPGEVFDMEKSLVAPHVAAGQVKAVDPSTGSGQTKQQATPKDKQFTGGRDK